MAIKFNFELAFEDVDEALCRRGAKFAARFKFGGVLGKTRAHRGPRMHYGGAGFHSGERRADEGVGRKKDMIVLLGAARLAKIVERIMHGTSFFEIQKSLQ